MKTFITLAACTVETVSSKWQHTKNSGAHHAASLGPGFAAIHVAFPVTFALAAEIFLTWLLAISSGRRVVGTAELLTWLLAASPGRRVVGCVSSGGILPPRRVVSSICDTAPFEVVISWMCQLRGQDFLLPRRVVSSPSDTVPFKVVIILPLQTQGLVSWLLTCCFERVARGSCPATTIHVTRILLTKIHHSSASRSRV